MNGHALSGSRKLNKHWQSGGSIYFTTPEKTTFKEDITDIGSEFGNASTECTEGTLGWGVGVGRLTNPITWIYNTKTGIYKTVKISNQDYLKLSFKFDVNKLDDKYKPLYISYSCFDAKYETDSGMESMDLGRAGIYTDVEGELIGIPVLARQSEMAWNKADWQSSVVKEDQIKCFKLSDNGTINLYISLTSRVVGFNRPKSISIKPMGLQYKFNQDGRTYDTIYTVYDSGSVKIPVKVTTSFMTADEFKAITTYEFYEPGVVEE